MNKTLMGLALCGTLMLSIGVAVASQSPITMASMTRGYAATSADYDNDFYCRTIIDGVETYLTYSGGDKLEAADPQASAPKFTIDFVTNDTVKISVGEYDLGYAGNKKLGNQDTTWSLQTIDGKHYLAEPDGNILLWNKANAMGRAYASSNVGNAGYPAIYFYTQDEFDAASSRCNWADNNRRTALSNLAYDTEGSGGGDTPTPIDPDDPTGTVVTFEQSALAASSQTITQGGVTLANSSTYSGSVTELRIYKGQTLTVSSESTITKIEFTCTANGTTKYGPGCFAAQTGYTYESSGKKGTWVGESTSITFTASSNQVRITQIVVTLA